jgi:hypothetical protein
MRNAHGVEADGGDRGEVTLDLRAVPVFLTVASGAERAVRDAADPELLVADVQELSAHGRTRALRCGALSFAQAVNGRQRVVRLEFAWL